MLIVFGGELSAHGISVVVERTGGVWMATARYDGGIPVVGADVVIHGPGAESAYQEGRTDPAGRFVFMPAGPGEWRVRVDDGMGHRRAVRMMVEADNPMPVEAAAVGGALMDGALGGERRGAGIGGGGASPWRLAMGLSLLVGLTGFAYGYSARARRGSDTA